MLDSYGAKNPAEFFAVATECFFEKPEAMLKKHPELYQELALYYAQDPALRARMATSMTDAAVGRVNAGVPRPQRESSPSGRGSSGPASGSSGSGGRPC